LIDLVADSATALMDRPGVRTLSLGMSIPGLINRRLQKAVLSPNLHITDGHSPDRELSRRLEIDCVMYQETQALCLGQQMYGVDSTDDFAMLEISTGLGLGVVSGGRLMEGRSGLAGELGHITVVPGGLTCGCGNKGCLETVATDSALARAVSQRVGRTVDIEEAARLIRDGEVTAREEIDSVCEYLSIAIAAAINIFNPATLLVHGRLFDAEEGLFERVCELTRRRALAPSLADCTLLRAKWSKSQAAVAAAILQVMNSLGPVVD
jgi:N-acetylglucosamine repressor